MKWCTIQGHIHRNRYDRVVNELNFGGSTGDFIPVNRILEPIRGNPQDRAPSNINTLLRQVQNSFHVPVFRK